MTITAPQNGSNKKDHTAISLIISENIGNIITKHSSVVIEPKEYSLRQDSL